MKAITIIQGFLYGSITFFIGPYFAGALNQKFSLPTYDYEVLRYFAVLIALSSILIFLYCVWIFWFLGKGTPALVEPPRRLVIKGIYKYTRNPIYIAHSLILLSYSLYFGHLLLYIYFSLAVLFYHLIVVLYEEPRLKKLFGKSYDNYKKKVSRWILF